MNNFVTILLILACLCIFRGAWQFLIDFHRANKWWQDKLRNEAPDSVVDKTIHALIGEIQKDDSEFETKIDGDRNEIIRTRDSRIIIHYYNEPQYIWVEVVDVGKFHVNQIKPHLVKELSRVCMDFKAYMGTLKMFAPKPVKTNMYDCNCQLTDND